jgi:DNA-binding transcriptional MocR family regulator
VKKYELVINRVIDLIRAEMLKEGERLPSVRSMAKQLGFSVTTVLEGYLRLESNGIIRSKPQSGYFVQSQALSIIQDALNPDNADSEGKEPKSQNESVIQYPTHIVNKKIIPLGSPLADMEYFPNKELGMHISQIASTYPEVINNYSVERESESLVDAILKCMMQANCVTPRNEIVVTGGGTQAMMIALKTLCEPGQTVAVESPGYRGFFYLLDFLKLNVYEVPSNSETGLSVEELKKALQKGLKPACLLLSSNFSNPTGALMPDERKRELVKLCEKYDLPIIEDDTFGEVYFTGHRPTPLKALWPEKVIYIGSFTKTLAPGYRVAWIASGQYMADARRYLDITARAIPMVLQMALASFIKDNGLKNHLHNIRQSFEENINTFREKVLAEFPSGTKVANPKGGQFLWVELPQGFDTVNLYSLGQKEGISTSPGILFSSRNYFKNCVRLNCCARKWDEEVEQAIVRLGEMAAVSRAKNNFYYISQK